MAQSIRAGILDDHQSVVDGYLYRLERAPDITVVATASYGEELEPMIGEHELDVLLLDVHVPTAPNNDNPYPILHMIPKVRERFPTLRILTISMYDQRAVVKAVMKAGSSGYILKDDRQSIQNLESIVRSVAQGGVYFSQQVHNRLLLNVYEEPTLTSRQQQVLSLCVAYPDVPTSELAKMLDIANSTLRNLLSDAYGKLGVHSKSAAIDKARTLGLITTAKQYDSPA